MHCESLALLWFCNPKRAKPPPPPPTLAPAALVRDAEDDIPPSVPTTGMFSITPIVIFLLNPGGTGGAQPSREVEPDEPRPELDPLLSGNLK
jgi:hypothetical protein